MYSVDVFKSLGFKICLVVSKTDFKDIANYIDDSMTIVIGGKNKN